MNDIDPLYPLTIFYEKTGSPLPQCKIIDGAAIPQPQRSLLVHDLDMTPTLEAHYGDTLKLAPLVVELSSTSIMRQVVLFGEKIGRPVEFGAIWIDLSVFDAHCANLVRDSSIPLGAILRDYKIAHNSCPAMFFHVIADEVIQYALALNEPAQLYGRRNTLTTPDGRPIAQVVEILAPSESD